MLHFAAKNINIKYKNIPNKNVDPDPTPKEEILRVQLPKGENDDKDIQISTLIPTLYILNRKIHDIKKIKQVYTTLSM